MRKPPGDLSGAARKSPGEQAWIIGGGPCLQGVMNSSFPQAPFSPNPRAASFQSGNPLSSSHVGGERIVRQDMLWGFPPFKPGAGYGTNFQSLKNHLWRAWLDREHRCVVPATAFSEPDKNTPKGAVVWRWFERADKQPFFFAGIWRPWTGDRGTKKKPNIGDHALFSIMTTEPNAIVEPIHETAMPVMLMTPDDVEQWLSGATVEDAQKMQKPAPDDAIVIRPEERKAA
jgi:putative SOS response-associated peptidase YedK